MAPLLSLLPTRKPRASSARAAPASPALDAYFLNSPGLKPNRAGGLSPSHNDASLLDWNDLLQESAGTFASGMLNDESFRFGADESIATMAGPCLVDEAIEEEDELPESIRLAGGEGQQRERVVVEPAQALTHPPSSLAPLPPVAVPRLPAPPATGSPILPELPSLAVTAVAPVKPAHQRPRASLLRPAHILPKGHPAHPRQSIAVLPPHLAAVAAETTRPSVPGQAHPPPAPHGTALEQPSLGAPVPEPSLSPTCHDQPPPLAPSGQLTSTLPYIIVPSESSPAPQDPFASPSRPFDGDSSLPTIGVPLDLRGSTSTPARPALVQQDQDNCEVRAEITLGEDAAPIAPIVEPRKPAMAVTFDLPDMELSQSPADGDAQLIVLPPTQPVSQPDQVDSFVAPPRAALKLSTATLKRRASRAFEGSVNSGPAPAPPSLSASSHRRASRAFASNAVGVAKPHLAIPVGISSRLSSSTPQQRSVEDQPRTIIRLAASASSTTRLRPSIAPSHPPLDLKRSLPTSSHDSAAPLRDSAPLQATRAPATKAPVSGHAGLTLPHDFDFLARGAEREVERRRRIERREQERERRESEQADLKRKQKSSAWAASAARVPDDNGSKRTQLSSASLDDRFTAPGRPKTSSAHSSTLLGGQQYAAAPNAVPLSTILASEAQLDLSSASSALTKEALEASQGSGGIRRDLKRRVSTYLEGLLPGVVEETDDDFEAEERQLQQASSTVEIIGAARADGSRASPVAKAPSSHTISSRRPLALSHIQNQARRIVPPLPAHAKPGPVKVQPFTFGTTSHRTRRVPDPVKTASPVFNKNMIAWRRREADSVAHLSSRGKENPGVSVRSVSEQRQAEREEWRKKQREREDEVRRARERQRKDEAEQQRLKLQALRAGLVVRASGRQSTR